MSRYPTPRSLSQLARLAAAGHPVSYLLGDFLDAFYRQPDPCALSEAPEALTGVLAEGEVDDAFLGAVAESLAAREGWQVPAWAMEEDRYLTRPFFSVGAAALRATLLLESPPAFRSRNLFVTANALNRA